MNKVITISREFGSGGREVGFRLAQKLGIPFYDKEIISMAAEDSNIAEEAFRANDEVIGRKERINHDYVSCVIIGRCSDIIVENGFHVFICAGMKKRIERMQRLEPDETVKKLESRMREIDRKRRDYYQYYSGNEWGNPRNYHLSLNSGKLGIERCVDIIAESVMMMEK